MAKKGICDATFPPVICAEGEFCREWEEPCEGDCCVCWAEDYDGEVEVGEPYE